MLELDKYERIREVYMRLDDGKLYRLELFDLNQMDLDGRHGVGVRFRCEDENEPRFTLTIGTKTCAIDADEMIQVTMVFLGDYADENYTPDQRDWAVEHGDELYMLSHPVSLGRPELPFVVYQCDVCGAEFVGFKCPELAQHPNAPRLPQDGIGGHERVGPS